MANLKARKMRVEDRFGMDLRARSSSPSENAKRTIRAAVAQSEKSKRLRKKGEFL